MLARETMCGLVALPAQGLQIREAVRFRAFGMVHVEVFHRPTPHAAKMVPHLGPGFPFCHL
jgi:hypothetical protein